MKRDEDARLLDLAARIADGLPVDWSDAALGDAAAGPIADELKTLAAMARHLVADSADADPMSPPELAGFTVERELGRGGGGVVYLARDERLERHVALKVLPPGAALDPERLARIEREAKLLASLNHPHVATIHGIAEDARGSRLLILEYVPGESLATRLGRGRLPVAEAAEIGGRIAEALLAAHDGGVIHRDLKPANVMLGAHGRLKVLDFGLALRRGRGAEPGATISGTWAYLSPECLNGEEDHRADVFSFGCVLFECLAGRRAFPGETAPETIAAVLGADPDWNALPPETPHAVRVLLEECLAKDPARRLPDLRRALAVLDPLRGGTAPVPEPPPAVPGLPLPSTRFIGRDRELTACRHALAEGRLVTLVGAGGIGKTRLAVEIARGLASRFTAGVFFADLAAIAEGPRVAETVAMLLGLHDDGRPRTAQVAERLRAGPALLVLDNCEHVRAACSDFAGALLEACPELGLLATSREPLGLAAEQRIELGPLALPAESEPADPDAAARADAVRLFVDRARRMDPGFARDPDVLSTVLAICRRVDALPLAIELAAARVSVLSAEEIAARLDRPLQLLRASGRPPGRHETMRATIAWSADELQPVEADVFAALAVFAGGWDLDAARAVCTPDADELETLDLLARLVDKSLVVVDRRERGGTRYRLLEPIRQFALESLRERGLEPETRGRHLAHYLAAAERAEPELYGAEQAGWIQRLAEDHENLLAALRTAEERPDGVEPALRIVAAIRRFWITRGHLRLGEEWCERALARADGRTAPRLRARAYSALFALLFRQNLEDRSRQEAAQREALALYREAGDREGTSASLHGLGILAMQARHLVAATDFFEQSLAIDRELGAPRRVAITVHNLALTRWLQGDREGALVHVLESDRLLRDAGDRSEHANGSVNVAFFQLRLGRDAEARASLLVALSFFSEVGSRSDVAASALLCAAEVLAAAGACDVAARLLGAARALLARTMTGAYEGFPWDGIDALTGRLEAGLGASLPDRLAQGEAMPPDEAFRLAIEALRASP